ncbi:hypothetical protein [Brumicola blandensis]|uniref:Uncharacterized protein n=1 Tax=Brumicola blandensis TaxID=3075611 RepID=A0AAW8QYW7_9ALTE|nr:hypothetical protein [Alteromonas sp. W409]MDT0581704.1 hypothetical protein [Alteromonas sp. W409]
MSLTKVFADDKLVKDIMQCLTYYAFLGAFFRFGLPAIKGDYLQISLYLTALVPLLCVVIAFTLIHVARNIVKKYYPEYGVKGFDKNYKKLGFFHPANLLMAFVTTIFVLPGSLIAGFGLPS